MIFEKRLAKIGKGFNVNLYQKEDENLIIFLYNKSMQEKCLKINNERYELLSSDSILVGQEIIKLTDELLLSRTQNNIRLVNLNEM